MLFILPPHCNNSILPSSNQQAPISVMNVVGLVVDTYIGLKNKSSHSYNVTFVGVITPQQNDNVQSQTSLLFLLGGRV